MVSVVFGTAETLFIRAKRLDRLECFSVICSRILIQLLATGGLLLIGFGGFADDLPVNDAKGLVQLALQAELQGLTEKRNELLAAAIKADPDYAPARWQLGQVLVGAKNEQSWLSIEESEQESSADPVLAEYAKVRRSKLNNGASNEVLAKWCQRRGLSERARIHWAQVLQFHPDDKTAIRRLGLKEYQGRLFTRAQLAEIKQFQIRTDQLQREWRPRLAAWRKVYLGKDKDTQKKTSREIARSVRPELVGLLETQLSPFHQRLSLAVVDGLSNVKQQVATESLLRHATMSKWSSVRTAATEELKDRPLHGYVPILIDAMMSPYRFQSWTVSSPMDDDHVLALNYSIGQRGKHADHLLGGTVNFLGGRDDDRADEIRDEIKERVEKLNEATERFNKPIWQALKLTTGQDLENDPSQWNDWWNDYNEYHVPDFKPVFTSFQRPRSVIIAVQPFSCFPAGTQVSTQTGLRPIEDIRIGDFVLSQNAVTGELGYKPVTATTVRQSDAIMELDINDETLHVTRGHPMWVNGRQWQMAKQLQRADLLHGVNGPVKVEAIRPASKDTKVFNLIVSEFHTYFVGSSRVLVHDNSLYVPPGVSIPGEQSSRSPQSRK